MSRSISKKTDRAENRLTVVLIRGSGGLRTYNLSTVWFRIAGAVIICLILALAGLGYQNYTLRQDRQRLVSHFFLDPAVPGQTGAGAKEGSLASGVDLEKPGPEQPARPDKDQAVKTGQAKEPAPAKPSPKPSLSKDKAAAPAEPGKAAAKSLVSEQGIKPTGLKTTGVEETGSVQTGPAAPTGDGEGQATAGAVDAAPDGASAQARKEDKDRAKATQAKDAAAAGEKSEAKPAPAGAAEKPEEDAAKLAAAVAENLAEDRLSPDQMELDSIKTMRLAQPRGIKISYKIKNLIGGGRRISGYAFMIGLNENLEPVKAFPSEAVLDAGQPVNYKQGRYFSIRQYTTIRGRIYTDDQIAHLEIMIYDLSGQLVMTKRIEADDA